MDDLGQGGIRADVHGLDAQRAAAQPGAGEDLVAVLLFCGDGFARDHSLVQPADAVDNGAVDRHLLAVFYDDDVPRLKFPQLHDFFAGATGPFAEHARGHWCLIHEVAEGLAGLS